MRHDYLVSVLNGVFLCFCSFLCLVFRLNASKAKFGDKFSLVRDYTDSIASYVGRFGPGMVIYWFGYIDDIALPITCDRCVLLSDRFLGTAQNA